MPGYQKRVTSMIASRLEEAEALGSCLPAADDSLCRALRRRCRKGEFLEPFPRLFVRPDVWLALTPSGRARHVLLGFHALNPGWVFGGLSAALLYGLQVPYAALKGWRPCIVSDIQQRTRSGRVDVCRHVFERPVVLDVRGLSERPIVVSGARQTAFDVIRCHSFRHGVAVADSALHKGLLTHEELVEFVTARKEGFKGVRQARMTARFADGRSANGGESIARAVMHELGFAAPELQVPFEDPIEPGHFYYADYVWKVPGRAPGSRGASPATSATSLAPPATPPATPAPAASPPAPKAPGSPGSSGSSGSPGPSLSPGFPTGAHAGQAGPRGLSVDAARMIIGELDGSEKYFDARMTGAGGSAEALLRERRRESRLTITGSPIVRFSFGDVLDTARFSRLLDSFGVPRDHEPLIEVPPDMPVPVYEEVPLEAYFPN